MKRALLFLLLAGTLAAQQSQTDFEAARELFIAGKYVEALAAFQKFEAANKFSTAVPDAIYYEGWCWFNQERYQEASTVFDRLLKGYPTSTLAPEAILKKAECLRELKQLDKASALYREFQTKYPKHSLMPQAILGEGWMRFKTKDLAGAKAAANRVRQGFPDDVVAGLDSLFLLGQVLTEEKNYNEARTVYRQISQQRANPRATEGLYLAGEAMYEAKRYTDAIAYYEGVRSTAELLDNLQRQLETLSTQRGEYMRRESLEAWQTRVAALQQLQSQIKTRPDLRTAALFRIANCYQSLGRPEEASVVYRHLLDKYPNDKVSEQANFGLIQTLAQRGQHDKAGAETEAFKKKYPKSLLLENATLIQAEAMFGQQNYRDALPLYENSLAGTKDPQVAETIEFRIASCYFNLEQFTKARDAFAGLAKKYPQGKLAADALFRLGQTYYEMANRSTDPNAARPNLVEATKAYEEIRAKYPAAELFPEATFRLGYLHSFLSEPEKAIGYFQEFIQKSPNHTLAPEAMYQIARNHLAAKRYDNAVAAYRAMVEKFPDHALSPFASFEIASAYADAKKFPEMIEALRDFVRRYPDHGKAGDALYAIGSQLESQRKTDEAIVAYRDLVMRATNADPLSDELRNAALGAQVRIASLLEPKPAIVDCEGVLAKFSKDPSASRALVAQIAALYRKAKLPAEGFAKLDQLAQQYQANAPIRIACATSTIELAIGEKDFARAGAAAAKLLADPERDRLPESSYVAIGNVFLKTDKFAPARDAFEKVSSPVGQLGLGQALFGLNQFDAAEAALKKIPAPAPVEADLTLARIYEAKGKLKESVDLYNAVLQNTRGEAGFEAAYRLGNIFFNMTDPAKSKDNKKTALAYYARLLFATGPMAEEAAYRAGECHEALGNAPQACSAFQGYAKRFPTGKFVNEAKAKAARVCAEQP